MARTPRPWYRATHRQWYTTMSSKQVPLGISDPNDEAGAWAALRQLLGDVSQIKDQLSPKASVRTGAIPGLVTAFLTDKALTCAPVTMRGYSQYLSWLSKSFPGETPASLEITVLTRAAARMDTWGDTHRSNVLACVGSFLKWCGRIVKLDLPPKASKGADSMIPENIYKRCLAEAAGDFRQLIRFLWLTGCRPGEATGLTVESVDWNSGTAMLKQHKTRKKGKNRVLFLGTEALSVIAEQREKYSNGLLFRGLRGRRLGLQAMTMRFQRLSEKVGHKVTSYMTRHTFITRALLAGIADVEVAAMVGHASTAMIHKAYSHVSSQSRKLRENADRLAG